MRIKVIVIAISVFMFINCNTTKYDIRYLSAGFIYNPALSSKQVMKTQSFTKLFLIKSIPVKAETYKNGKIIGEMKFNASGKISYFELNKQNGDSKFYYSYLNNKLSSVEIYIGGIYFSVHNYYYKKGKLNRLKVSNYNQNVAFTVTLIYRKDFYFNEYRNNKNKNVITEKVYLKQLRNPAKIINYDTSVINNLIPHIFKKYSVKRKEVFLNGKLSKKTIPQLIIERFADK